MSENVVYVQEETIPSRVICKSRANPGKVETVSMMLFIFGGVGF